MVARHGLPIWGNRSGLGVKCQYPRQQLMCHREFNRGLSQDSVSNISRPSRHNAAALRAIWLLPHMVLYWTSVLIDRRVKRSR